MRTTRRIATIVAVFVLAAACGSSDETVPTRPPAGGDPDDRYRWEVCRTTVPEDDPSRILEHEVSFGYADHDRGLFIADHVHMAGTPAESRMQFATQGDELVSRFVAGTEPDTAFLDDDVSLARDEPVRVDRLRTRSGVLEEFGLSGRGAPFVDDSQRPFERFESLPRDAEPFVGVDPPPAAVLGHPITDVVWVLDVWSDDRGTVDRLRLMTRDIRRRVAELRFTSSIDRWDVAVVPIEDIGCTRGLEAETRGWFGYTGYDQTLVVPLAVSLDPVGEPYDVVIPDGVTIEHSQLGSVITPNGTLMTLDGIAAEAHLLAGAGEATEVAMAGTELNIELVEEIRGSGRAVLGVRLQAPGSTVARWGVLVHAYGTSGGRGAVVAGSVLDLAIAADEAGDPPVQAEGDLEARILVSDLDETPGTDLIIFSNGFGDGAFPMSRGYNTAGQVIALYVFDNRYPWRLMVPDGIPPRQVREREAEYLECMRGTRRVLGDGSCTTG